MNRKLITVGLILFPLTGIFCLIGVVMVQLSTEGHNDYIETAMRYARIYRMGFFLSILAFIVCLIAGIKSSRQRSRLK